MGKNHKAISLVPVALHAVHSPKKVEHLRKFRVSECFEGLVRIREHRVAIFEFDSPHEDLLSFFCHTVVPLLVFLFLLSLLLLALSSLVLPEHAVTRREGVARHCVAGARGMRVARMRIARLHVARERRCAECVASLRIVLLRIARDGCCRARGIEVHASVLSDGASFAIHTHTVHLLFSHTRPAKLVPVLVLIFFARVWFRHQYRLGCGFLRWPVHDLS